MLRDLLNKINTRDFMALELSTALVALVFVLALRAPESDAFKILLGALISQGFTSAIGYYFNSSKGSEDKSKTIETQSAALATSTPAVAVTTTTHTDATGATTTTEPASTAASPIIKP